VERSRPRISADGAFLECGSFVIGIANRDLPVETLRLLSEEDLLRVAYATSGVGSGT
jgi:hypothetical protein